MVCYRRGVTGVRKPPCIPCNQFNNKCNTCSCVILNKKWLPHKDRCMRLAFVHVNTKRQVAWFLQLLRLAACNTACTTACGDAPKEASSKCAIRNLSPVWLWLLLRYCEMSTLVLHNDAHDFQGFVFSLLKMSPSRCYTLLTYSYEIFINFHKPKSFEGACSRFLQVSYNFPSIRNFFDIFYNFYSMYVWIFTHISYCTGIVTGLFGNFTQNFYLQRLDKRTDNTADRWQWWVQEPPALWTWTVTVTWVSATSSDSTVSIYCSV